MNDILNKPTVLVLNRHWQAIHVKTPAEAFCMIATGAASSGGFVSKIMNTGLARKLRGR